MDDDGMVYTYLMEASNGPNMRCSFYVTEPMSSTEANNQAKTIAVKNKRMITVYAGSDGKKLADYTPNGEVIWAS